MKNVMIVEPPVTDCRVTEQSGAFHLTGTESNSGRVATATFGTAVGGVLPVRVGGCEYRLRSMRTDVVPGPAANPRFGVTTVASAFEGQSDAGAMVIVVNCGQEPPFVSITARHDAGAVRSWVWTIDHRIQHRLLTHLRAPGHE